MQKEKNLFELYEFFNNPVVRWVRVFLFFVVGLIVFVFRHNAFIVVGFIPTYGIMILQELFIFQKLNKYRPINKITQESLNPTDYFTFHVRALVRNKNIPQIISELQEEEHVKYFAHILGVNLEVKEGGFDINTLFAKSLEVSKKVNATYINDVDIFASYLLLLDQKDKILFNQGTTEDDVLSVLAWVRKEYSIDKDKKFEINFTGNGVFDFFVYGWSAELSRYATNLTQEVLGQNDFISIGREKEYEQLITALSRSTSSNALIIGDAGVGKTTLIKKFILDSNQGILPKVVSNKIVFKFYPEKILAGITSQGQIEERITLLFQELLHAGNIAVYIPNIENLFGGGGMNLDISGVMMDYLTTNKLKVLGSLNENAYQNYIYPKQELKQLFDIVKIEEPDFQTTFVMVMENAKRLSHENRVIIEYKAVKEVCKLSSSYLNDGTGMPGRAVKLLDDVIAFCKTHNIKQITPGHVRDVVEGKVNIVLDKPTQEESKTLLNLETEIHKRIVSQNEAVVAISNAMRRVRSGLKNEKKPIASFLFLGPTGVGKTETAKALAFTYFGDETSMIRLDMSEYQRQDSIERFLGASQNENYEATVLDKVLEKPFSLILMDEFEKAHPQVIDLFLQVFDEGRLTDNRGRTVSFKDAIIIATSNAGSEFIREKYKEGKATPEFKQELVDKILSESIFKPELINRFDDVIVFKPLEKADVVKVAGLYLDQIVNDLREKQIEISYTQDVSVFIAERSYSIEFGARNVRRFIEQTIQNQLSRKILEDQTGAIRQFHIKIENNQLIIY